MKYRKKGKLVDVIEFNTTDIFKMNDIVAWANKDKTKNAYHLWHNSNDLFYTALDGDVKVQLGYFIVKTPNTDRIEIISPDIFNEVYKKVDY